MAAVTQAAQVIRAMASTGVELLGHGGSSCAVGKLPVSLPTPHLREYDLEVYVQSVELYLKDVNVPNWNLCPDRLVLSCNKSP